MTGAIELVAPVRDDAVGLDAGGMLPAVSETDDGAAVAPILRVAGDPAGRILAPASWVLGEPDVVVHLVAVGAGSPWTSWLPVDRLDELPHPAGVAAAIRTGLDEASGRRPWPSGRPDWFRPGWLVEVDAWIDDQLDPAGEHRTGASVVLKLWSLSAVLRVPVTGGRSVFLKAGCDWFGAEAAVTALLGRVAPGQVPDLIAMEPRRGWLLMLPLDVAADHDPRLAVAVATTLARLQIEVLVHVDELRAVGAPDRGAAATTAALRAVVEDGVELDRLTTAERSELHRARPWLEDRVGSLFAGGLPLSVGHGDLHLGNVARSAEGVVLYDWSDAAVTAPVLDVALLARSAGDDWAAAVLAAYGQVWRAGYPEAAVDRSLELAPVVNTVYQAVSYEGIGRAQELRSRWELGGIQARLLRRLLEMWSARLQPGAG